MNRRVSALLGTLVLLVACSSAGPDTPLGPDNPEDPFGQGPVASVYTTSVSGRRFDETQLALKKAEEINFYKVQLSGEQFQTVDGFGMAITQASCFNLLLMMVLNIAAQTLVEHKWAEKYLRMIPAGQAFFVIADFSNKNILRALTSAVISFAAVLALSYVRFRKEELK